MSAPSAINNARQILIGKGPLALTASSLKQFKATAVEGEVGLFTTGGVRITAANAVAGMPFVVAVSRGAGLAPLVSDQVDGDRVTTAVAAEGSAAVEQVTTVGFNGTSGSIADVLTYAGELYKISVNINQFLSGTDDERIKNAFHDSTINDDQVDIAVGLRAYFAKGMAREVKNSNGDAPVVASAITNSANAAFGGTTANVIWNKGQKLVFSDAVGVGAITGINIGDYVRPSGTVTDGVYKVVGFTPGTASTAAVIELDIAFQEDSATVALATNDVISAANAVLPASDWGVAFEGKPLPFSPKKKKYAKTRFQLTINKSFGSTVISKLVGASEGVGTYEAIASLERFLIGFKSEQYEMGEPYLFDISEQILASPSQALYDTIALSFSQKITNFQDEISPKEILIAVPSTAPAYVTDGAAGLSVLLETIVGLPAGTLTLT